MPAVSDSQFTPKTTQPSVLALESTETASLGDGDMGVVQGIGMAPDTFYVLDVESIQLQNGTSVLWTLNSNPLFGAPAGTPGRWVLMATSLGCSCPTGPTGPSAGDLFAYDFISGINDLVIPTPGPTVLLTLPGIVATSNGSMDADMSWSANTGPNGAQVAFWLEISINGGAFTNVGGSSGGPGLADGNFSGATTRAFNVTAGDLVVARVSASADAAGAFINVDTGLGQPGPDNHLAARLRFFPV